MKEPSEARILVLSVHSSFLKEREKQLLTATHNIPHKAKLFCEDKLFQAGPRPDLLPSKLQALS